MKNSTRIGSSLLGTWSAQTNLFSNPKNKKDDKLTAYFIVHFMADPRKGYGCALPDCHEIDNHVCMVTAAAGDDSNGNVKKSCHDIAKEKDILWSDCKYLA